MTVEEENVFLNFLDDPTKIWFKKWYVAAFLLQLKVESEKINIQPPISTYYILLVKDVSILDKMVHHQSKGIHHLPIRGDNYHFGFKVNFCNSMITILGLRLSFGEQFSSGAKWIGHTSLSNAFGRPHMISW